MVNKTGVLSCVGFIQSIVFITTKRLLNPIIIQRNMANNNGFIPTDFIVEIDKLAPIKNKVSTRPFFAK